MGNTCGGFAFYPHEEIRRKTVPALRELQRMENPDLDKLSDYIDQFMNNMETYSQIQSSEIVFRIPSFDDRRIKIMKTVKTIVSQDTLEETLRFLVKATLMCALKMTRNKVSRVFNATPDDDDLKKLNSDLNYFNGKLLSETVEALVKNQLSIPGPSGAEHAHNPGFYTGFTSEVQQPENPQVFYNRRNPKWNRTFNIGGSERLPLLQCAA